MGKGMECQTLIDSDAILQPTDPKDKNKQIRYLQYKGFTIDMIFEALS
ncbi:RecX family transcriptional regulator [Salmonella enterica subsp. diarizonae]|nr:RecX family transcriptional regulator [Salmonella enterica subsp. diarizonae]ECF5952329.1 RecX family transcriptional regulator [Salmonella enterica subsp. diarizonae]